jgi:hypothetical protein
MTARIYRPAKNAMQSGMKRSDKWIFEYDLATGRTLDPLMGWTGSDDMQSQIKLTFKTKEDAICYAKRAGIEFKVKTPKVRKLVLKSYADVFAFKG